jgi:hypothetical protein
MRKLHNEEVSNFAVHQILFVRSTSVRLFVHIANIGNWEIQLVTVRHRPGSRREHDIEIKSVSYIITKEAEDSPEIVVQ